MNKEITVSFVLPVYNVAPYLSQCLESVLCQSLTDYEIILVNDGSGDGSLSICREYESKFDFIQVIDQTNQGVSAARNNGMHAAKGKYICFLDADDYYISDFAKGFYEQCEKHKLDIIRGIYCVAEGEEAPENTEGWIRNLSYYNQVLDGGAFLCCSMREHANEVVPWLGFFRREYLLSHHIAFPLEISFEEDQIFFLRALIGQPCRIMQTKDVFYAYRQRQGSITALLSPKKAQDAADIVSMELELAKGITQPEVKHAAQRFAGSSFFQITNIYGRVDRKNRAAVRKVCSLRTKLICILRAANMHQSIKNAAFTFAPHLLGLAYDLRNTNV